MAMSQFLLDRLGLAFVALWLPVFYFAAFNPQGLLRLLSLGRRRSFPRWGLLSVRVPAIFVALAGSLWVLLNLAYALLHR